MHELIAQQLAAQLLHLSALKNWPHAEQPSTAYDVAKMIVRQEGLTEAQAEAVAQRVRQVVTIALAHRP